MRGGHHRAVVSCRIGGYADVQRVDFGQQVLEQRFAVPSPTATVTGSAMQRSPAEPNAAPTMSFDAWSKSASGSTMPWFLAPPMAWTRLPLAVPVA